MTGPSWRSAFETIVATLDYPMFIVTTAAEGRRAGCLVGFGTQTSIAARLTFQQVRHIEAGHGP
jgi:flavin reductase (DIM6/NTAB) family NADH-FMN oxidoreductase RutF